MTKSKSFFTSDELSLLQRAFDLACADLRLRPDGRLPRERLGACLFEIASTGEANCTKLRRQSVQRFLRGDKVQPITINLAGALDFDAVRTDPKRPRPGRR